jgi:hypothetical protein
VRQLLAQFWHKPPANMVDEACRLVSTSRHMRELKRVVSLAQRDARKNKKELEDHHFFHAITMLAKMASGEMGEDKA